MIDRASNSGGEATVPVGRYPNGVAITPNGKFAYVANQRSNTVSVIDTANNTVVHTNRRGGMSPKAWPSPPMGNSST